MTEEEIQALQTELEAVKAEKETLTGELQSRVDAVAVLEQAEAERTAQLTALTTERDAMGVSIRAETQQTVKDLTDSYNLAVSAYKSVVAGANPAVPAELITGDTIEALDRSMASAKVLVAQVRQVVEADIAAGKVPAGAPARTPPDLSAMSPREKIQYAVGGKK